MAKTSLETLAARLDMQAIALQELARTLTPEQAAAMAEAVRARVAELAGRDLSHAADAAVAGELAALLDALTARWARAFRHRQCSVAAGRGQPTDRWSRKDGSFREGT